MQGVVFFSKNLDRAQTIADKLSQEKNIEFSVTDIALINDSCFLNAEYVAFPWDSRDVFWLAVGHLVINRDIAIYDDNFFTEVDDFSELIAIRDKALANENWDICKGINEVLIYSDVLRRRTVLNGYPTKLQIETTDLCNAKCIMCSHAYYAGSGLDIIEQGILERIEKLLPYLRVVVLHGNGEPFLKKNITEFIGRLKKYNIKFITNTNLSILDDDLLKYLREDFVELNISCDGHNKKIYESIRQGLNFERFVENVKRVRQECPQLTMKMAVVVMRQNLQYLTEIVRFASQMGFNEIDLNQLCVDEKNNNTEDAPYLYIDEYRQAVAEAVKEAEKLGIQIRYPAINQKSESGTRTANTGKCFEGICDWLVESPFINLQGNIGICCINQKKYMGNIFEEDFSLIWNNSEYSSIRKMFYEGKMPSCCGGCDFLLQDRLKYIKGSQIDLLKETRK